MENSQMCPLEFSPVRTLDDFLLGSARFQAPTFHDAQRCLTRPRDMLLGLIATVLSVGAIYITSTSQADVVKVKKDHPLVCLAIIVSSMYILFQMFDAVMFAVFALLMPALLILFHASCRLRNVRNKIENKIEALGVKKSPMGHMLEMCGLHLDLLMKVE
ncbi:PRA1 family protein [Trichinella nativa]|uniref:PRA1 family protein n=1 Tax=Trichinella nativa TaxID=6335 RepID=A0A1Y3ESH5_9BILA|nr:PRA1 family protein [Trichinella nativa]